MAKDTRAAALKELREHYKTDRAISAALGGNPTPQAVGQWKAQIPQAHVFFFEANGPKISRYRQRPDIYGPEPK